MRSPQLCWNGNHILYFFIFNRNINISININLFCSHFLFLRGRQAAIDTNQLCPVALLNNLGLAYGDLGRREDALAAFRGALDAVAEERRLVQTTGAMPDTHVHVGAHPVAASENENSRPGVRKTLGASIAAEEGSATASVEVELLVKKNMKKLLDGEH